MTSTSLPARVALLVVAAALPVAISLTSASPASASAGAVTLSAAANGSWAASGSSFSPGRTDVQLWIQDTTSGGWSTLEYQAGLNTSAYQFGPCSPTRCAYNPGGLLTATGALYPLTPPFSYRFPVHTLACGHSYLAVAYDPADGYSYSNTLTEASCPPPPR